MTDGKLIFRNVRRHIRDYFIYFLTLMISVSMFYAFNSIQTQPAFRNLDATKQLLSDQLEILLSALSVVVAVTLAFLIVYANRFLLKRRKKELGIYMLLGMEKGKISRIFAGETLCAGMLSLVCGLFLGLLLSQGLSILSLRLFAVDMSEFEIVFSISAVLLTALQANRKIYLKGLNAFLCRQIGSRIQTDFMTMSVVCGLLTASVCGISVGISSALTMNETSDAALPYDLNVVADVDVSGETDIAAYLKSRDVDLGVYADFTAQISLYEAEITYGDLFEGQDLHLWSIDRALPEMGVSVISVSDFNRALAAQGKESVELADREFLLNCNYRGTLQYMETFLQSCTGMKLHGTMLQPGGRKLLSETCWMTSVGNNDRGTFIVPDHIAASLRKDTNILLVQYKPGTDTDAVLQKMIPIGLEWKTEGYRYSEKTMMSSMYYGSCALLVFLCCYLGLIFLLICAALLSIKQLTETADHIYRYGLLQKLGADSGLVLGALFRQIAIFFVSPLLPAGIFSAFGIGKMTMVAEKFLNMHISTHIGVTVLLFLIVYGGYFVATYLSCRHMVMEKQVEDLV